MANLGHRATIKYITCFPGNQTHAKKRNCPSLGFRRCMVHDTFRLLVLHTLFIYFISHIISSFIPMMVGFYHVVHWRPTNYPFCCHRILSPIPMPPSWSTRHHGSTTGHRTAAFTTKQRKRLHLWWQGRSSRRGKRYKGGEFGLSDVSRPMSGMLFWDSACDREMSLGCHLGMEIWNIFGKNMYDLKKKTGIDNDADSTPQMWLPSG